MDFFFADSTQAFYTDKHFAMEAIGSFDTPANDCMYVTLYVSDAPQQPPQVTYDLDLFDEAQCEKLIEAISDHWALQYHTIHFAIAMLISLLQLGYSEA